MYCGSLEMNRNQGEIADVLSSERKNVIRIELSPEIVDYDLDPHDSLMASLLAWADSFYGLISNYRSILGLDENTLPFPGAPTYKNLIELVYSLGPDNACLLTTHAEELMAKFRLNKEWELSMKVVILTNVLMVPPRNECISFYEPSAGQDYSLPYPAIYFTAQITIDDLKKWLDNKSNKGYFRYTIKHHFPMKKASIKIDDKTLIWGQIASLLKLNGIHSWTRMSQVIIKLGHNSIIYYPSDDLPTPNELRTYYYRFVAAVSKVSQPMKQY